MASFQNAQTDRLVEALLSLQDATEAYMLLEDLCTIRELQDLAQRLEVARLLRGKVTYSEITSATSVSAATISRVNRALTYGAGGYNLILDRLENTQDD